VRPDCPGPDIGSPAHTTDQSRHRTARPGPAGLLRHGDQVDLPAGSRRGTQLGRLPDHRSRSPALRHGWTARFHGRAGCRRSDRDRPLHSIRRGLPAHGRILCRRRERQPLDDPKGPGRRCPRPAAVPPNARRRSGPSWRARATRSGLPVSARDWVRAGVVPAASTRRRRDLPCRARDRVCRVGAGRHGNVARARGCPRPAVAGRHARRAEPGQGGMPPGGCRVSRRHAGRYRHRAHWRGR